jgi:outer membrane immunogenic protein
MNRPIVTSLTVAALSAGLSLAASAADLTPYTKGPPVLPFTWTGVYFGGNAGYGFQTDSNSVVLTNPSGSATGLNETGGFVGIQMGYNYQMGMLVLGLEGDVQASNVKKSVTHTLDAAGDVLQASGNWGDFGTIRGRIGAAFDRLLIYGTGGAAIGDVSNTLQVNFGSGDSSFLQNDATQFGYVVGAGVEYAVVPRVTVKLEYQYINLGSYTLSGPKLDTTGTPIPGVITTSNSINNDIQTVRLGVNWRFQE